MSTDAQGWHEVVETATGLCCVVETYAPLAFELASVNMVLARLRSRLNRAWKPSHNVRNLDRFLPLVLSERSTWVMRVDEADESD